MTQPGEPCRPAEFADVVMFLGDSTPATPLPAGNSPR